MDARAIVDTGYLVALLNRADSYHAWAVALLPSLRGPWLTAEACVSEAVFVLERAGRASVDALFEWMNKGLLSSRHFLPEEMRGVRAEMFGYRGRWVDFADACVVRMSDQKPGLPVVSVDSSDFSIYFRRRPGRRLILP